ncbi:MAG: hypothetical protein C4551_06725 [Bacillota bacterium]|nr:MAG: hypothetical protein C4551_06725 [Bacillota bacterium]
MTRDELAARARAVLAASRDPVLVVGPDSVLVVGPDSVLAAGPGPALAVRTDPVVRYRLLRDILTSDIPPTALDNAARTAWQSPQVLELAKAQHPDGGWGRFHSQDVRAKAPFQPRSTPSSARWPSASISVIRSSRGQPSISWRSCRTAEPGPTRPRRMTAGRPA